MTATLKITNLQNESSVTPNIVLNADGTTTIAATTATALTTSGNLNFTGTGNRITGDFSNATVANRIAFQSSTVNGATQVNLLPNGTSIDARIIAYENAADPANSSFAAFGVVNNEYRMAAGATGTSTFRPMTFYTGGSERLRLDTSGNLGLGVPPSAWFSGYKVLQIGDSGSLFSLNTNAGIAVNAIDDGAWKYRATGFAGRSFYSVSNGSHVWVNAPSGTAGNAISFTQAMTLDASGNLGVGTTAPSARLHVLTGSTYAANFYTTSAAAGTTRIAIGGFTTGAAGGGGSAAIGAEHNHSTTAQSSLTFYTHDGTNQLERARIDPNGNLLVGTTTNSNTSKIVVQANGVNAAATTVAPVTSVYTHIFFRNPNGNVGEIRTDGSATAYNTSSDYRLKENVAPMQNALATVAQLNPVTYTWKADGSAGQGFIAHELQAVVPDAVTGKKDAVDADGKPQYQGVDTSFLVATLTAAIQEQQAIITQLQADVAALKGAA